MHPSIRTYLAGTTALWLCASAASAGPDALDLHEARHLIARTGFGAAPHEIAGLTGLSRQEAVAQIMQGLRTTPATPMPDWAEAWYFPSDLIWALGRTQTDLYYVSRRNDIEELSAWWVAEMVATPSPLTERLVLFWSDHFANSFEDHENSQWMARQNAFLRQHAAGNFADLAQGMLMDPAMIEFLDNDTNFKDAPNENLGREFLELFTLGEGRGYSQSDVRAAAAILTGLGIADQGRPVARLKAEAHDDGPKTLFGQTGRFGPEDLTRLTLQNPAFGPYIVEKLWLAFVSDHPDPAEVARLSRLWHDANFEIRPLIEALLMTDAFWDPAHRGRLVKSPIELMVGTVRTLGLSGADSLDLVWTAEELDQMLFNPPNVGGWPKGVEWINDATAAGRATALQALLGGEFASEGFATAKAVPDDFAPPQLGADDLRVGQVFATYVEERDPGEGFGGSFTLFDVGFGGHEWRSIPFWLEYLEDEDFTALYVFTGDCAPQCFASLPKDGDDPDWVALEPWDDALADYPDLSKGDLALIRALGTHLPQMIASTSDQTPFHKDPEDSYSEAADHAPFGRAAELFAQKSQKVFGASPGAYLATAGGPNRMGTGAGTSGMMMAEADDYLEADAAARRIGFAPDVTYRSARDWMNALPGDGLESTRAADVLLAVPPATDGLREELIVGAPEALLRRLILSPAYQVK